jgi:hypothetical protein
MERRFIEEDFDDLLILAGRGQFVVHVDRGEQGLARPTAFAGGRRRGGKSFSFAIESIAVSRLT